MTETTATSTPPLADTEPSELRSSLERIDPARFHPSFWEEVSDFLQHRKVRRLEAGQQRRILNRLAELSLDFSEPATAGDVRRILFLLNRDRYRAGDDAAGKLLELGPEDLRRELRWSRIPGSATRL